MKVENPSGGEGGGVHPLLRNICVKRALSTKHELIYVHFDIVAPVLSTSILGLQITKEQWTYKEES